MSRLKIGVSTVLMLMMLSIFGAVAFAEGTTPTPPTSTNPAPGINVGDVDNFGNQMTHRTHGNFQNNTNSCANCHSTHNGEDSKLMMKSGEYELCMSCHDGTMGFYNVDQASGAGVFNSNHQSASMHAVTANIKVNKAPGAYKNGALDTMVLECSSCHNPHGSVNDRLLRENVINGTTPFAFTGSGSTKAFVPTGTKTINLELSLDPQYKAINDITGNGGLKIYTSVGPKGTNDKTYYAQFCGACHNDYLSSRSASVTTRPSNLDKTLAGDTTHYKYTHTANSSSQGRNCASCHFAHGTDATTMMDTQGLKVADYTKPVDQGGKFGWSQEKAEGYMKDVSAGGSNLKKYTGTVVCWTCHQSTKPISTNPVDPQFLTKDPQPVFPGKSTIR